MCLVRVLRQTRRQRSLIWSRCPWTVKRRGRPLLTWNRPFLLVASHQVTRDITSHSLNHVRICYFQSLLIIALSLCPVQRGCRWAPSSLKRTMTAMATWTLLHQRLLWEPEFIPSSQLTDSRPNASLARSFLLLPRQRQPLLDWWEHLWCLFPRVSR